MANFFKRKSAAPAADKTPTQAEAPKPRRRDFNELKPDPDKIGISGSVPFVRLPDPTTLFADRAARLDEAAPGHPLEAYLRFVAEVARAQAAIQAQVALPPPPDGADLALRSEHGMPPLSRHSLEADPGFDDSLLALLDAVNLATAPEASAAARESLRAASREDRLDLALQVFEGALPVDRIAECVFVSAALQVRLAEQAARLDSKILKPVADGVCPCCGGAPVASVVVGWTPADKARYLSCSLCGTYGTTSGSAAPPAAPARGSAITASTRSRRTSRSRPARPATATSSTCTSTGRRVSTRWRTTSRPTGSTSRSPRKGSGAPG